MNVYVVMSWSQRAGTRCVGLNMNQRVAEGMAERAVEGFINFSGCGGAVASDEGLTEFWAENDPDGFKVKIETKKLFVNFANP